MNFRIPVVLLLAVALCAPAAHALKLFDSDKLKGVKEKLKVLKEPSEADEIEIGKGVAANLLGSFWVQGNTTGGTDTLRVQVFDGFDWSLAKDISIVTQQQTHQPPVVTVTGSASVKAVGAPELQSWAQGTVLPFTFSDADGDHPVTYRFTDVDGASTSAHMWFNVSAATLNGKDRKTAVTYRNSVALQMTAAQIGKAQGMARRCQDTKFKECG